jgi:hypothetical protein
MSGRHRAGTPLTFSEFSQGPIDGWLRIRGHTRTRPASVAPTIKELHMRRFIATTVLCLSAFVAQAGGVTTLGKINSVQIWPAHNGVLIQHQNMINPDGCGRSDHLLLRPSDPFFKEMYAMLLSAQASGKQVQLHVNGCEQNFPVVIVTAVFN